MKSATSKGENSAHEYQDNNIIIKCKYECVEVELYLLFIRDKHFLGFLDHGLGFQFLIREFVLARIEQLSAWNAGQNQVCGVRLEIDVHLNGIWVNWRGCVPFYRVQKKCIFINLFTFIKNPITINVRCNLNLNTLKLIFAP